MELEPVSYFISILDDIDLGWRVTRLQMTESISHPYELIVELVTEGHSVETETDLLLGRSIELVIQRGGLARPIFGVVRRIEDLGAVQSMLCVVAHVVPALSLLGQRKDTRIFQGQTVPEIVADVLGPALAEYGREVDTDAGLSGDYEPRDCCVQFRESDLDFCNRLLEEEGIAYIFEPDEDNGAEKMVLIDSNDAFPELEFAHGGEVDIIQDRRDLADRESLNAFDLLQRELPTGIATRAYNFKGPSLDEFVEGEADERGRTRELYLYGQRRQITDDPNEDPDAQSFTGEEIDQREPQAKKRFELERRDARVLEGGSNLSCASPGMRFMLGPHARDDVAHLEYLIMRVRHQGEGDPSGGDGGTSYSNSVECIPKDTPYRPARRTHKPRVFGSQTATVMGPADDPNEDIHTDPHGRVKVRFHWDRLSPEDEHASCWVRCAQMWAGAGWGSMFIPRVGMEVVVTFLDGNPDRPLIVGCVYNGTQTPPYTLPDDKTKSTIKSDSSPGGGGFNEFRFEDSAGSEEIYLHAQKDLNETILNCMSTSVGADQSLSVGNERSKTVDGNETVTVKKDRVTTIEGSETMQIMGSHKLTIDGGAAKGSGTDPGAAGSGVDVTGEYNITATEKFTVTVGDSKLTMDTSTITLETSSTLTLKVGGSTVTLVPDKIEGSSATVQLSGGDCASVLKLDGDADMEGGGKVLIHQGSSQLQLDGDAHLKAATTTAEGSTLAELKSDTEAKVSGGPSAKVGATAISIEATGNVDVKGAVVNLNG